MRLLLLILFVGTIFAAEEKAIKPSDIKKVIDAKDVKKPTVEKEEKKTGKRDSSDQTGLYAANSNDEPFKPIIGLSQTDAYEAAAATHQATYYDKNQLTTNDGGGGGGGGGGAGIQQQRQHQQFTAHDALTAKDETINRQAVSAAYQRPYSQVIYQQQQQPEEQQQHKQQLARVAGKNNGNQQKDGLYATPHNAAYNYERLPVQYQQQQQHQAGRGGAHQRPQQIQYVIAIPMSYLRQLQQQLLQQQQQQQPSHLQPHKAAQHQQQPVNAAPSAYAVAGPLARDHQGTYRPFHRFAPPAVTDVQAINAAGHQQQQQHQLQLQQQHQLPPPVPGYVTQYIQIPASALLAAAQSAQVYQRPTPQQVVYQQHHQQEQHQQQQQQQQSQSPQFYYYYQTPQQHESQQAQQQHPPSQQQLKQSPASHVATSPPLYAYQIQDPQQQHHQQAAAVTAGAVQHLLAEQQRQLQHQHQQLHVGRKEQTLLRSGGGGASDANANLAPTAAYQHGSLVTYEHGQQAIAAAHQQAQAHSQPTHAQAQTQTQNHQEPAQVLTVPQEPAQKTVHAIHSQTAPQAAAAAAEHSFEPVSHYNSQYLVQYLPAQQQKRLKYQQSQPQLQLQHLHLHPHLHPHHHRLQLQAPQQHTTIVDNLNNLPYSQGIHGPTPVPFVHLAPAVAGVAPAMHITSPAMASFYHHQPFVASALQPGFAPLGMPSKVTSFTNVLLQPFGHGHGRSYEGTTTEIGAAGNALPYFNHVGGVHYGTHLYHPPTPATPIDNKQPHHQSLASASASAAAAAIRASAQAPSTAKTAKEGSRTIVKYP